MQRAPRRAFFIALSRTTIIDPDIIHPAEFATPPLTTVRMSREYLSRSAFDALTTTKYSEMKANYEPIRVVHLSSFANRPTSIQGDTRLKMQRRLSKGLMRKPQFSIIVRTGECRMCLNFIDMLLVFAKLTVPGMAGSQLQK